ncbi:MAG: hypothetical protein ACP5QP_07695 [Brevinematia bacterium]
MSSEIIQKLSTQATLSYVFDFPIKDFDSLSKLFEKTGYVKINDNLFEGHNFDNIRVFVKNNLSQIKKFFYFTNKFFDTEKLSNLLSLCAPLGMSKFAVVLEEGISEEDALRILTVSNQLGSSVVVKVEDRNIQQMAFEYWLSYGRNNVYPSKNLFKRALYIYGYSSYRYTSDDLLFYFEEYERKHKDLLLYIVYDVLASGDLRERIFNYLSEKISSEERKKLFPLLSLPPEPKFQGEWTYKIYDSVSEFYDDFEKGEININVIVPAEFLLDQIGAKNLYLLRFIDEIVVDLNEHSVSEVLASIEKKDYLLTIPLTLLFIPYDNTFVDIFRRCLELGIPVSLIFKESTDERLIEELFSVWVNSDRFVEVQPFSHLIKKIILENYGIRYNCALLEILCNIYNASTEKAEMLCRNWFSTILT